MWQKPLIKARVEWHFNAAQRYKIISGFTLIQMSIVLVLIGLVLGGVMVGQNLIKSAETRALITQIEQYNTAANEFKGRYGYLPGDIPSKYASKFGFTVGSNCTGNRGSRDGNGLIEGGKFGVFAQGMDETGLFWQDLSSARLIDVNIPNGGAAIGCGGCPEFSGDQLSQIFPVAKIGSSNYVYIHIMPGNLNWFGIYNFTKIVSCGDPTGHIGNDPSPITVITAYNIDKKIDDGFPMSGSVEALHISSAGILEESREAVDNTDPLSCYFRESHNSWQGVYSITASTGNNSDSPNCALSFLFH